MMERRVIFVNRFFYPDHSATSQLLSDLAFHLVSRGWSVLVIASRQKYDSPRAGLDNFELIQGVQVYRVWSSTFGRDLLAGRAVDYASFYIAAFLRLRKLIRAGDVVVVKTDPPLLAAFLAPLIRRKGGVLVNWLQDLFPEVAQALGLRGANGRVGRLLVHLRNWSLRQAASNVVLGERMAEQVGRILGVKSTAGAVIAGREAAVLVGSDGATVPHRVSGMVHSPSLGLNRNFTKEGLKIRAIPNWSQERGVNPVSHKENPLRSAWGLDGRFVLGYSGNMGRAHEFDTVIDAVSELKCRELNLLFIGGGARKSEVVRKVKELMLPNVIFQPYQPREKLGLSLSVPDIHLVSLRPEMEGLIVPSKFYGILAAGRPVLFVGDPDGELGRILIREEIGWVVRPGDVDSMISRIDWCMRHREIVEEYGKRARKLFEMKYTSAHALDAWTSLLEEVYKANEVN